MQLLEGSRGRLKHSIDCVPPPDPQLAYEESERVLQNISSVQGQLMVPLAFISKAPMRHLDVTRTDGTPMPLLGSEETSSFIFRTVIFLLTKSGVQESDSLKQAIQDLVTAAGDSNLKRAEHLVETGAWGEDQLWPPKLELDGETKKFLYNVSTDFVLIGLIPASQSGLRQILKFSYHWTLTLPSSRRQDISVAFRFLDQTVQLPMHMPAAGKSYHLEFQVPPELEIRELALPEEKPKAKSFTELKQSNFSTEIRVPIDRSGSAIAHVHTSYKEMPADDAVAILSVPRRGLWSSALLVSLLTAVIFLLALCLCGAMDTLMEVGGNAAALLLAAPAIFVGFLAVRREHALSSQLLDPLRAVILICALLLFAMAGSVVGGLVQPWRSMLWISGASFALLCASTLLLGPHYMKRKNQGRDPSTPIYDSPGNVVT